MGELKALSEQLDATRIDIQRVARARPGWCYNCTGEGTYHGIEWRISHNDMGFRCGYVKVPKGHPWFGVHHDAIDAAVHGGLTYSAKGLPRNVPRFSYQWWIGFDCAHAGDAPDLDLLSEETRAAWTAIDRADLMRGKSMLDVLSNGGCVRSHEYVEAQCVSLARQVIIAAGALIA